MGAAANGPPPDALQSRRDLINAVAGASSGVIAAIFVCPLDLVKTRFHVYGHPHLPSSCSQRSLILASWKETIKRDGFKGLYRGLSPTILALIPTWAVYFTVYEKLKSELRTHEGQLTVTCNVVSAIGAGSVTAIVTNPLWVVKTRFMTHGLRTGEVPYQSTISALISISSKESFKGLYSGLLPSLLGVSHAAIQFPAYENLKASLAKMENTTQDKLSAGKLAFASGLSKLLASTLTYPHEVIRSKLQDQAYGSAAKLRYTGVVDCTRQILQNDGVSGLYRGFATNLIRTIPANVITLMSFELILRFLRRVCLAET